MPWDIATKNLMLTALPSQVWVDLHSGVPTIGNTVVQARRQVTLPAASNGQRVATGSPVCTFDSLGAFTAAYVGLWDALTAGNRIGYYDNPDISLAVSDKIDLNSLTCSGEDVAGK